MHEIASIHQYKGKNASQWKSARNVRPFPVYLWDRHILIKLSLTISIHKINIQL